MTKRSSNRFSTFTACIATLPEPFTVADICAAKPELAMTYVSDSVSRCIGTGLLVETGSRTGRNYRMLSRSQTFADQLTAQRIDAATPTTPSVSWADGARLLGALVPWLAA